VFLLCDTSETRRELISRNPGVVTQNSHLDARVMYMVTALQTIKKDPTANTVPGKKSEVAWNKTPKDTGPAIRKQ
jgi:hypothetical protein